MRTTLLTILSLHAYIMGAGWAVGAVVPLFYAFKHRELPKAAGIRLLGGPFEALGIDALIASGLVFVVVSALRILAAYWLWNARLDGAVLELILLGLSAIFWYGFELPLGPVGGVVEVVLLVLVWGALH